MGRRCFAVELKKLRTECKSFRVSGYSNRLKTAADLRCLALDGLLHKNSISPEGTEIRPGVWIAKSARVHPRARIVAPAFIGVYSKIRAAALITRGTVVEHHADRHCALDRVPVSSLRQSQAGGCLRGPRADALAEWVNRSRAGSLEGRQSALAGHAASIGLAVATSPTRLGSEPMVPGSS